MSEELKPCPFCGGKVSVVILDDEGNIKDKEYERDPYSGLSYAMAHDDPNGACPIATYDEPLPWLYDSRDSVAHAWNRRAERTCKKRNHDTDNYYMRCCSCSRCDAGWFEDIYDKPFSYCPHCGAKVVDE